MIRSVLLTGTVLVISAYTLCFASPQTALAQRRRNTGGAGGGFAGAAAATTGSIDPHDPGRSHDMELVYRVDVRQELLLTLRQKNDLDAMQATQNQDAQQTNAELRGLQRQTRRNQPQDQPQVDVQEQRDQIITQYYTGQEKKIAAILKPEQMTRLHQLDLRWRGALALTDPKVAQEAELSPADTTKITPLKQDYITLQGTLNQALANSTRRPRNMPQLTSDEIQQQYADAQRQLDKSRNAGGAKVLEALPTDKQDKWKTMIGDSFHFRDNQ